MAYVYYNCPSAPMTEYSATIDCSDGTHIVVNGSSWREVYYTARNVCRQNFDLSPVLLMHFGFGSRCKEIDWA